MLWNINQIEDVSLNLNYTDNVILKILNSLIKFQALTYIAVSYNLTFGKTKLLEFIGERFRIDVVFGCTADYKTKSRNAGFNITGF